MLRPMTMRPSAVVLVLLCAAALGACDADGPPHAEPSSATDISTPVAVSPSPGEVRLSLYTHCGVRDIEVAGIYWAANPPVGNNPPGWDDTQTEGRWRQTSDTTALFLADSGEVAAFVRAERPDPYGGCA